MLFQKIKIPTIEEVEKDSPKESRSRYGIAWNFYRRAKN